MIDFDKLTLGPCMAAFGVPVRYHTAAGAIIDTMPLGNPLVGIYEGGSKAIQLDRDGPMIDAARPTLGIRVSDLVAAGCDPDHLPTGGELMEFSGRFWRIAEAPPPDSVGHLCLALMVTSR